MIDDDGHMYNQAEVEALGIKFGAIFANTAFGRIIKAPQKEKEEIKHLDEMDKLKGLMGDMDAGIVWNRMQVEMQKRRHNRSKGTCFV